MWQADKQANTDMLISVLCPFQGQSIYIFTLLLVKRGVILI